MTAVSLLHTPLCSEQSFKSSSNARSINPTHWASNDSTSPNKPQLLAALGRDPAHRLHLSMYSFLCCQRFGLCSIDPIRSDPIRSGPIPLVHRSVLRHAAYLIVPQQTRRVNCHAGWPSSSHRAVCRRRAVAVWRLD